MDMNIYFKNTYYAVLMVFNRDDKCLSLFGKEIEWGNFEVFNSNRYLVAYYWKDLFTKEIMRLRKGVLDIPGKNGGLSNSVELCITSCVTLTWCLFGHGRRTHL